LICQFLVIYQYYAFSFDFLAMTVNVLESNVTVCFFYLVSYFFQQPNTFYEKEILYASHY